MTQIKQELAAKRKARKRVSAQHIALEKWEARRIVVRDVIDLVESRAARKLTGYERAISADYIEARLKLAEFADWRHA